MHACRHLQKELTIAYFGPAASFSHAAALRCFGRGAKLEPVRTISEVFSEVDKGRVDFGVVPIENSTGGGVYHSLYDSFEWLTRFADPTFKYHAAQARVATAMMMRMASADVLPYDYAEFGRTMTQ